MRDLELLFGHSVLWRQFRALGKVVLGVFDLSDADVGTRATEKGLPVHRYVRCEWISLNVVCHQSPSQQHLWIGWVELEAAGAVSDHRAPVFEFELGHCAVAEQDGGGIALNALGICRDGPFKVLRCDGHKAVQPGRRTGRRPAQSPLNLVLPASLNSSALASLEPAQ